MGIVYPSVTQTDIEDHTRYGSPTMTNVLRPSPAEAAATWAAMVAANREQVARYRETPEDNDFYAPVASAFRANPHRTGDSLLDVLLASVRPGETWLDIGAGAGRFGLPIALKAGRLIAVDASAGMLAELEASAIEHSITNVEVVNGRWPVNPLPSADCSLIANVGMDIEDFGGFLDAMEASTTRLCVALMPDRQPTRAFDHMWPEVHGVDRATLPSLPELLVLLVSRGRRFEVTLSQRPANAYESKAAILAAARRQTWVEAGSAKDRRLEALIDREAKGVDGGWTLNAEPTVLGVVRWAPREL